jgi:Tfp pilus assembly PilM family ATPase
MNYHDSILGFSLTSVKLQLTEISYKQNEFIVSHLDEVYFNQKIDFVIDKETKISSLLQVAFEEINIKNELTSNIVSFSLPQELFITARLPIENSLLNSDLIEEFRWQLSIMYPHLNWNDYVIRYSEADGNYIPSNDAALVFALNRKYIKIIKDFCSKNNLKLKYIDQNHLTSNNILAISGIDKTKKILSFYISDNILSVLVSLNGKPDYYEDIPIKSGQEIRSIIIGKLDELNKNQLNFSEAYLFGEVISNPIAKALSEATGINFILINPFTQLKVGTNLLTNKYYSESNHFFSSSAGLAARI